MCETGQDQNFLCELYHHTPGNAIVLLLILFIYFLKNRKCKANCKPPCLLINFIQQTKQQIAVVRAKLFPAPEFFKRYQTSCGAFCVMWVSKLEDCFSKQLKQCFIPHKQPLYVITKATRKLWSNLLQYFGLLHSKKIRIVCWTNFQNLCWSWEAGARHTAASLNKVLREAFHNEACMIFWDDVLQKAMKSIPIYVDKARKIL